MQTKHATRPIPIDRVQVNQLTQNILRSLPSFLGRDEPEVPIFQQKKYNPRRQQQVAILTTNRVGGREVEIPVFLTYKRVPTSMALFVGGQVGWIDYDPNYFEEIPGGAPQRLNLFVNSSLAPQNILEFPLSYHEDNLRTIISHEITHVKDWVRVNQVSQDHGAEYYNSSHEVRAFMQQIYQDILDAVDKWGEVGPDDFWLLKYFLGENARWKKLVPKLTPASRKLILKGVANQFLKDFPQLQERYPQKYP